MKRARRILVWVTGLLLAGSVQALDYTYTTNGCCEITITKYTGTNTVVTIPDYLTDLPVTTIGENAFASKSSVTSVTIGTNVTSIGDYAFSYCFYLTNAVVTIPNSVTNIGDYAFYECRRLTSVTIGTNVTSIGVGAFYLCAGLTSVTIPASVTNIGEVVFWGCFQLTGITVDVSNPVYSSADGVLFDKSQTTLLQCPGGRTGSYTIPTNVTNIGFGAFMWCTNLTSVTIPNGVTSIREWTFTGCDSLTSVIIPNSITNIEYRAFSGCTSLTSMTIPNGVISIGSEAFSYCTNMTSFYLKGKSPSLGSSVFSYSTNATIYYLPGTTGWTNPWGTRPTVCWNPTAWNLGVAMNQFGFGITGSTGLVIVVEACTNLANPVWVPLSTNTLTGGVSSFTDPQSSNYPARFYRFRAP